MDGQTVVFAGLITENRRTNNVSIPGLNRIPVIRNFFDNDRRESERSELVIMLTPRIIRTQEEMNALNLKEYERMAWCAADVINLTGDPNIRRRSDVWSMNEVRHTPGTSMPVPFPQPPMAPMVR
jgi:type II secretory pathway component GspD/PulD (secretin)